MSKPRRSNISITWTSSEKQAVMLALMGFQIEFIANRTSLTEGQIYYRLRKLNLQELRQQYKTGDSPIAKRIINTNAHYAAQIVYQQIVEMRRQVAKQPRGRKAA